MNEHQKNFQKEFDTLCGGGRRAAWEVWTHFIEIAAISLSLPFCAEDIAAERKSRFDRAMNSYTEKERAILPKLFQITLDALEQNPAQDFLGTMFMGLNLNNHWRGQFFTPYSISEMMARITLTDANEKIQEHGWTSIYDPACGAGALLIAARNISQEQKHGYRETLYVAQDIDYIAGLMCYIQLSVLGCAGYVVIGNTLTAPVTGTNASPLLPAASEGQEIWFTPMLYDPVWQDRIRIAAVCAAAS